MHLEALAQAAQDRDRVLNGRLVDHHGLEAALERGVLLDVAAVLVERGRADAMQLAARQHRLEHVAGVHRALGRPRADHGVQLVDEQQDPPLGGPDLPQHRLEALLELAAELGAGHERAEVEGEHRLVAQTLGHVPPHDALGEALDDGGLADAGLADQHGVVLGLAGEDLDRAPDLLVPPDDRIELSAARLLDEVAAILLERLVGCLGCRAGHALAAAHLRQRLQEALARRAVLCQQPPGRCPRTGREQGEDDVLDGDVLVLEAAHLRLGVVEHLRERAGHAHLAARPRPAHARPSGQVALEICLHGGRRDACALQKPRDKTVGLCQECQQDVLDVDLRVAIAERPGLRIVQGLLCLLGQQVRIHAITSGGWEARSGSAAPRVRRCVSSSSLASTAPA